MDGAEPVADIATVGAGQGCELIRERAPLSVVLAGFVRLEPEVLEQRDAPWSRGSNHQSRRGPGNAVVGVVRESDRLAQELAAALPDRPQGDLGLPPVLRPPPVGHDADAF